MGAELASGAGGKCLLFILADRLSRLIGKGEMPARYYNPGEVFDHVHLLTTSSDVVDPVALQAVVGRAQVHVHRLWTGADAVNAACTPVLERLWARRALDLAFRISPDLVRTGDRLTGYLGWRIRRDLGVPHIISLHADRDDQRQRMRWGPLRLMYEYERKYALRAFPDADAVVVVYESLQSFAEAYGARRVERIYNVISPDVGAYKSDYELSAPPSIVSVGRLIDGKLPVALIRAMAEIDAELTLVGDGPGRPELEREVRARGLEDRVRFIAAMPNRELCEALPRFDLFAAYNDYPGIPKAFMEALWAGLPVVVNDRQSRPVPELQGPWLLRVGDTPRGYAEGIGSLLADHARRGELARRGRAYALETFDPAATERQWADLYRRVMADRPCGQDPGDEPDPLHAGGS